MSQLLSSVLGVVPRGPAEGSASRPRRRGTTHRTLLFDYGMDLQGGFVLIPKMLELVARWSWFSGDSGDLVGDLGGPTQSFRAPNGVGTGVTKGGFERVQVNPGAFTHFHEADEYTLGVNCYFRRQLLKWQTDFSVYQGGNPTPGGQSAAGFIPGVDGWMIRTQIQFGF